MILSAVLLSTSVYARETEEFRTPVYEGDEADYLISPQSSMDGVCRLLTEDEEAYSITATSGAISGTVVSDLEADPYWLAVIDEAGKIKRLTRAMNGIFSKKRFLEKIHCSRPAPQM